MLSRGVYKARMISGGYSKPELLPGQINTKYQEIYPFIAPDESFLLFCSTRPRMEEKERDIFISFRSKDDTWSEPVNLSEALWLETGAAFRCLSPDGKHFFSPEEGSNPEPTGWRVVS